MRTFQIALVSACKGEIVRPKCPLRRVGPNSPVGRVRTSRSRLTRVRSGGPHSSLCRVLGKQGVQVALLRACVRLEKPDRTCDNQDGVKLCTPGKARGALVHGQARFKLDAAGSTARSCLVRSARSPGILPSSHWAPARSASTESSRTAARARSSPCGAGGSCQHCRRR